MLKDNNYIVIQSFMVSELGLKGNELIIYAIIYGFSQDGNQHFSGSLNYLEEWTNITKQCVIKTLKRLLDKGFICKKTKILNGVKFCEYWATKFTSGKQNLPGVVNKIYQGGKQSLPGGGKQSLPNNIYNNNISNNINNNINKIKIYGIYGNVKLSDEDLNEIRTDFPSDWSERIEALSGYMESTGKKYKNHLATIRNWARREKVVNKSSNNNTYEPETYENEEEKAFWDNYGKL